MNGVISKDTSKIAKKFYPRHFQGGIARAVALVSGLSNQTTRVTNTLTIPSHDFFAKKFLISPFDVPPILLFELPDFPNPDDCLLLIVPSLEGPDSPGGSVFATIFELVSSALDALVLPFAFAGASSASSLSVTDSYEE